MRIQEARMKKTKKVNKPYESSHLSRYGENLFSSNRESIFIALRRNSHHIEKRFSIKGEHLLLYIPVFSLALCTFSSFPPQPAMRSAMHPNRVIRHLYFILEITLKNIIVPFLSFFSGDCLSMLLIFIVLESRGIYKPFSHL